VQKETSMAVTDRALSPVDTRRTVIGGAAALIAFGGRLAECARPGDPGLDR